MKSDIYSILCEKIKGFETIKKTYPAIDEYMRYRFGSFIFKRIPSLDELDILWHTERKNCFILCDVSCGRNYIGKFCSGPQEWYLKIIPIQEEYTYTMDDTVYFWELSNNYNRTLTQLKNGLLMVEKWRPSVSTSMPEDVKFYDSTCVDYISSLKKIQYNFQRLARGLEGFLLENMIVPDCKIDISTTGRIWLTDLYGKRELLGQSIDNIAEYFEAVDELLEKPMLKEKEFAPQKKKTYEPK